MSEIRRYILVDLDDVEEDYEYESYQEAYESARKRNMAVVAHVYTYDDSELVWTPDGSNVWPPEKHQHTFNNSAFYCDECGIDIEEVE